MGQESSLAANTSKDESFGSGSQLLLTDIAFERTDNVADDMDLTELWVFGIPGSQDGACYSLMSGSSRRWELTDTIALHDGVKGIDCVLKGHDVDIGFVHIDCTRTGTAQIELEQEHSTRIEVCDGQVELKMSWRTVVFSESKIPVEDIAALNNMGAELVQLFARTGDLTSISEAIMMLNRAVQLTPEGHADLPAMLSNLGCSFRCRFQHTGDLSDIAEAVSAQQRAVQLTPEGHADLPTMLMNFGKSLRHRFERTGDSSDITEAVSAQQRAVQLTPEGHADLPAMLSNLGISFQRRFECTGDLSDIAEAVSTQQRAVQLTPEGHAALPGHLDNLGISFHGRFERTGDLSDIAEAILAKQRAVQLTPEGHAALPGHLSNLGVSFHGRFERTGDLSDIAEAISAKQRAVQLTPEGHADLPGRLSNLGNSFHRRFECTGDLSDIAEAVSAQQRAVQLTPEGHAALPIRLSNLGISFQRRFERTGDVSDIAEAVSAQQRAVQLTPEGHAALPIRLSNLGMSFRGRFKCASDVSDIAEAVSAQKRAVQLTPEGHAHLPGHLVILGDSLYMRSVLAHSEADWNASTSAFKLAATCVSGPVQTRLQAAMKWARLLNQHDSPLEVVAAFNTALALVALIGGLEQTVRGRFAQLKDVSEIAREAASAAFSIDRPDKALEWLEQGRCLVWSQLTHLRTPLDTLRIHHEQLAERMLDVSKRLENAGLSRGQTHISMSLSEKVTLEEEARSHLSLAREWEKLLCEARAIPDFESFLQPPSCATLLQNRPESGPIVMINVEKQRCDALALVPGLDEPLHIPLPEFSLEKATTYHRYLDTRLKSGGYRMREADTETKDGLLERAIRPCKQQNDGGNSVRSVLRGLWMDVVKPILDMLAISKFEDTSGKARPRIWWCPTGALSFLPIHAAGIYGAPGSESVMDYAVCSYTPTVTAITNRVKNRHPIDIEVAGLFLTCQPNAPGAPSIPGTTKEVQSIHAKAQQSGIRVRKVEGGDLTIEHCLEHLEHFSSVHLACHGSQNTHESLRSRFLFHNGTLDLATIMQKDLKNADFAFLSACQTSTGDEKLSEEAVHLAAGMLAAGYRRVVGTMWSIGDSTAQKVANDFYDYLWRHKEEGSGTRFDGSLSAYALHHAIQELRKTKDDSVDALLAWIPFVHFGY